MKIIPLMIRGIRLATAAALLAGPAGPIFAATGTASSYKDAARPAGAKASGTQARIAGQLKLPQYFEANRGQTDPSVKFFTRAGGYNLYLTATESVMVAPAGPSAAPGVVRMKLKGANPSPAAQGLGMLPSRSNYMRGNDRSKWQLGVRHYSKVKFDQVYPGIDMVYRFDKGQVEYDFIVAPGAKPWRIILGFEGAKDLRLDAKGNLVLRTGTGEVTYKAPDLYQTLGSKRAPIKGRFVLAANNHVRFEVGNYIESKELVIDPALSYSTHLGGSTVDYGYAIAVDAAGKIYVTGTTNSTDFPVAVTLPAGTPVGYVGGATGGGDFDVFVTKLDPDLGVTGLLWSSYIGGSAAGDDTGRAIAVAASGKISVAGSTTDGINFPKTATFGAGLGGTDAFVLGLSAAGNVLDYSNLFGGAGTDIARGVAVDTLGAIYVTGETTSVAAGTFPVYPTIAPLPAQPVAGGGASQAFVAKFAAGTGTQVYATYLGGTGVAFGNAIAVDGSGRAYVTGYAGDDFVNVVTYPSSKVFKNTVTGAEDAFIAQLDPSGTSFLYKTYVGGNNNDRGTSIAVDGASPPNVYITGNTASDTGFPGSGWVTVGQTTLAGNPDGFVFKLNPGNTGVNDARYATYLGGSAGGNWPNGITVDTAFNAYVVGTTYASNFPLVSPIAGGDALPGSPSAFVTQLGPTGSVIGFSTYLGGTEMTFGYGIALDSSKNIHVTGYTNSQTSAFPTVVPFQVAKAGSFDAFVSKFGAALPPPSACVITNVNPASGFTLGGTTVTITGTDFVAYSGPGGVTFDSVNAQSYTVNTTSTVITAVTPRHPLAGALTAGPVTLSVTTTAGSCTAAYTYVLSPLVGGACVDEYFFPSPVTGATGNFAYCMAQAGTMRIMVYNAIGDLVAKIEDGRGSGAQLSQVNTGRLSSGVYLYRMEKDYGGGNSVTSDVKKFVVRH